MQAECFECGSVQIGKDSVYLYCRLCGTVLTERIFGY